MGETGSGASPAADGLARDGVDGLFVFDRLLVVI